MRLEADNLCIIYNSSCCIDPPVRFSLQPSSSLSICRDDTRQRFNGSAATISHLSSHHHTRQVHTHIRIHLFHIHKYICTYTHTYIHTNIHKHTKIHTHIYIYIGDPPRLSSSFPSLVPIQAKNIYCLTGPRPVPHLRHEQERNSPSPTLFPAKKRPST